MLRSKTLAGSLFVLMLVALILPGTAVAASVGKDLSVVAEYFQKTPVPAGLGASGAGEAQWMKLCLAFGLPKLLKGDAHFADWWRESKLTATDPGAAEKAIAWLNQHSHDGAGIRAHGGRNALIVCSWGFLTAQPGFAERFAPKGGQPEIRPNSQCTECIWALGSCYYCWPSPCITCY